MKTKLLCDILNQEQMEEIGKIIDRCTMSSRILQLKQYLRLFNAELEAKGVDSNYLAYSIEYALTKQPDKPKKGPKHANKR